MVVVNISSLNYFLPIFSFLLVFILVYAVLKKTGVLGDNNGVALFISLIIASFFIVNARMVEFVQFSSSWFAVFLVCVLFILMFLAFVGKDSLEMITKNKGVVWAIFSILLLVFVFSAARVFRWAISLNNVQRWFRTDWFGMVLLFVIAGIVAVVLSKK